MCCISVSVTTLTMQKAKINVLKLLQYLDASSHSRYMIELTGVP